MGFGIIGIPFGELTNESIKTELRMYLKSWLFELNTENYEKKVFSLDLKKFIKSKIELVYNESNTSLINNQRDINNHIIWELKSVNGLIEWIESIFDFYELDLHNLEMYKNQFEIKDKNQNSSEITNFIFTYKNNNSISEIKKSILIQEKVNEFSQREILYFCINMYLDFSKIEEFLKSKYNHNLPKEIKLQKVEKTFLDYITIENKEGFANDLKNSFNIEFGIDFKIMIELLKNDGIFSFTQFAPFFRSIKDYFNRDIGSQTALNDLYKHTKDEQNYYAKNITTVQSKLNPLITKYRVK
ncbi:hypothetical protein [Flavobacterium sp. LB2P53]|uniref:hypothetical protein n=2 Tax=unclassified Flavobacterium TaxID=196869 RepID=UPI000F815EE6|nr:hypothetical protein [Flavobacterium sp. LB2P53]RTY64798.1 hypothetical protein EKL95_13935 [Flavobacterium sp. LB2P53]